MKYGLIGEKLSHSWSCEIHEKIGGYSYELCELSPENLGTFMKKRDFCGINVTIPYKRDVIPYLDGISEGAKAIGAVNTVVNRDGKLYGYNTDIIGMEALLKKNRINPSGKKTVILGTGGTSETATTLAKKLGAAEIIKVSRKKTDFATDYGTLKKEHSDAEIIINTTPVGMYPASDGMPLDLSDFRCLEGVCDVIYNPLRTRLVQAAEKLGIPATGGLYMLCAQAVAAAALFKNSEIDLSVATEVYGYILNKRRNVFLIGMPTSGKSTVGRKAASYANMPFCDTDVIFKEKYGKTPAECICENGESRFRKAESEIIAELSKPKGRMIATGGGAVLSAENVVSMKKNGICVFLDRPLEKLFASSDRPLSSDREKLCRMYEEREPIYRAASDIHIKNCGTAEDVAEEIIRSLSDENFDFKRAEY